MIHLDLPILYSKGNLNEIFNLKLYKALFSNETYYTWNQLLQLINAIKAFDLGIQISLTLLEKFETFRGNFNQSEQDKQLICIYSLLLNMLDKSDKWEEYLVNWYIIKQKSIELKLGYNYSNSSRDQHFARGAKEYFIEDNNIGFRLSFMYFTAKRKDLIIKKLEKAKRSNKIQNFKHKQQEEYTQQELFVNGK
jgi:hypothetical protein